MDASTIDDSDNLQLPENIAAAPSRHGPSWPEIVGFWMILTASLTEILLRSIRFYFYLIGDRVGERQFAGRTFGIGILCCLSWFIGSILVIQCKRLTWYGIIALAMVAIPFGAVACVICAAYWDFLPACHAKTSTVVGRANTLESTRRPALPFTIDRGVASFARI